VSARTGAGLDELRQALLTAAGQAPAHRRDGVFRMPIDRVFSIRGFGTVVTGTVLSGQASLDEPLQVQPSGRTVKVRGLQGHGTTVASVTAGQRAAINLAAVEVDDLSRGDSLVAPGAFGPTRRLDASLEVLASARPVKHGSRVRFHQGTVEVLGRVAVAQVLAPDTTASPGGEIPAGTRAHVRLRLEKPVVVTRGDRFVLRAYSPPMTIAGGAVLDPHPARGGIRTPEGRRRFAALDPGPAQGFDEAEVIDGAVSGMLAERGTQGLATAQLVSRVGLSPAGAAGAVQRLTARGAATLVGDTLFEPSGLAALEQALLRLLETYHAEQPLSEGLPREEARERVFTRAHPAVFDAVLARLVSARRLVARDRLALASHSVVLSDEEDQARRQVEQRFRDSGLRPPDPALLPGELGLAQAAVERALTLLQRQKVLVKIDVLWFHAEALARLKEEVRALKQGTAPVPLDVGAFKDRYGVSRKYAIPLLEFLDRERVTRRAGEGRVVL
jgi:selenocysteine-specific elongation factor